MNGSPCAYPYVRKAKNEKKAWNNLIKAYEDNGLSRTMEAYVK